MADTKYNKGKAALFGDGSEAIDLENDTIKVMLVTSTYTVNPDHNYRNQITNEISNTGTYSSGGSALTGQAVTQDDTNDKATFDANDLQWTGATFTARAAVMYKSTGSSATDILIAYFDFGADKTVTAGTFDLIWDSTGIFDIA